MRDKWMLLVGFVVLVLGTVWMWNTRYELVSGGQVASIATINGNRLVLGKKPEDAPKVHVIGLPVGVSPEWLHVGFANRAVDLAPGGKPWQVGRLILEWHDARGEIVARDTLTTMKDTDKKARHNAMVVRAARPGLMPSLRVEHLGESGRMEIDGFEACPVGERKSHRWIVTALIVSWGGWLYGFVRAASRLHLSHQWLPRRILASALLLALGWLVVLPGPWAHIRPLGGRFFMQPDALKKNPVQVVDPGVDEPSTKALGDMPLQGGILVKVKIVLRKIRPLLHILLFAGPAFLIAMCCGTRCAWWSGILITITGESAQAGLWGVGWDDAADLLVNALGIYGGVWLAAHPRFFLAAQLGFARWMQNGIDTGALSRDHSHVARACCQHANRRVIRLGRTRRL